MFKIIPVILVIFFIFGFSIGLNAEEEIKFDFEGTTEEWMIPDWAYYQGDHKLETVEVSSEYASSGKSSLKLMCNFPGNIWTAVLIDWEHDIDLSKYKTISVDMYLPPNAPGVFLKGRIILTIGYGWYIIEMKNSIPLKSGKWTTVKANLESEETKDSDWKGSGEKQLYKHIQNVRKIAVRVEYDASPPTKIGPAYHGPIYIDNIVIK